MPFYLINAFQLPYNSSLTLSISYNFNLYLLQNNRIIISSPIDDTLEVSIKVFKGHKSLLSLRFLNNKKYELNFSEEQTCKEVHELLSDIKVKQRKLLEANVLDLTIEKTQVFKYNSKSGKKVNKYLSISHDIEEIQWSNSLDSIKYSCIKLRDIIDFTIGPISNNFQRVLQENPAEIEDFSNCFSLYTLEKTIDIRVQDENQARIWIMGLKRVLRSQRILKTPNIFYINQPFAFQKFLNILRQKSWESGFSLIDLIKKIYENQNFTKNEVITSDRIYHQRNSVNKYKYLSLKNINKQNQDPKTIKSIESSINPLISENFKDKIDKIVLRRSQTERNLLIKPHNSLPKNLKASQNSEFEEKENQESYNYQVNTSMNYMKRPQKTKIKLSFDKTSLKQKVWALMKENQESKSFYTTNGNNESFAGVSLRNRDKSSEFNRDSKEINRNSIENLTIEIANIDIISPKKNENTMNMTGAANFQEEFDNLNKRYKKCLDEYLVQSKDNEKLMEKILDLNRILREKNEEIHDLKYKNFNTTNKSPENTQSLQKNVQIAEYQKEIVQLKAENARLKDSINKPKPTNILLRKPSLNLSDRSYEIKNCNNNLGNFKDLLIKNQKLYEENNKLKFELQNLKTRNSDEVYKKTFNLNKQLQMLKIALMELKMSQQEDLGKFQDLWPHLFKIFEFQQQKLMRSEAKTLTLDKENKVLMVQMKNVGNH